LKAFVTGGTGFIGSHIVRALIARGIQVRILARKRRGKDSDQAGIEFRTGNVLDVDSLRNLTQDVDLVFSAFGILGQWGITERTYREVNVQGVINLLTCCLNSNIRQFLHISSAGVLGPLPDGLVADESFPLNPSNVYEKTKSEAEERILDWGRRHRFPFTIIRPEFVYGPGDLHILGFFKAIKTRRFFLLGDGKSLLHPTFIEDLIQGICLCLDNQKALGNTYLITGERPLEVRELVEIIAQELDVNLPRIKIPVFLAQVMAGVSELTAKVTHFEPTLTRSRVKFFTENRAFSPEKARTELGYVPKIDFREGVRRTIGWYRDNNYL
jgi:nucleoside-diphosphate-sugar epimerase